jgi:DNA-binding FadR family transcriptional regulator
VIDEKPISTYLDHAALVDAIKAKDGEAARATMERHDDKIGITTASGVGLKG